MEHAAGPSPRIGTRGRWLTFQKVKDCPVCGGTNLAEAPLRLVPNFLVPALGLSGLLPEFLGAFADLFFGRLFHYARLLL